MTVTNGGRCAGPSDHHLRLSLSEIMHGRSLEIAVVPARIRQWLILQDEGAREATAPWFRRIAKGQPSSEVGRCSARLGDALHIWEAHTEFSTITVVKTGLASRDPIRDAEWLGEMPGALFRSVEIIVGTSDDFDSKVEAKFDPARTVSSIAFGGAARIWSDFTIKDNHAGKIIVEDHGLKNDEAARLVQTLLEIGNYRKLALLGFPVARDLMPWIKTAEGRHAHITEQMNDPASNRTEVLADLLDLSAEVEWRASSVRYRLGATASYHLLAHDRLASLREGRVPGYSTWAEFIERRLLPAMRTCEISQNRLDGLSERINRSASLLSLEQTIALNKRSQLTLASMNRRAMLQLRLQSLVEGFSVFAISYYVIGLLELLLEPLWDQGGIAQIKSVIVAAFVPIVLSIAWIAFKRGRGETQAPIQQK